MGYEHNADEKHQLDALKAEAEKAKMNDKTSPIQSAIDAVMSELEYLSMDIARLDEVTHPVQARPNEGSSEVGMKADGSPPSMDTSSNLQRQLWQIEERLVVHRSQLRHLAEVIEL